MDLNKNIWALRFNHWIYIPILYLIFLSSVTNLQTIRQENRITVILIVVVIVFLFCQMPTALVLIYTSIHISEMGSPEENFLLGLGNIFNLLVAINASCNFLLYTALSDKYRKYFCGFFLCRKRNSNTNPSRQFDGNLYELDTMDTTLRYALGPLQTIIVNHNQQERNCRRNNNSKDSNNDASNNPNQHNNLNHYEKAYFNHRKGKTSVTFSPQRRARKSDNQCDYYTNKNDNNEEALYWGS